MGVIAQAFDRDLGLYQKILVAIEQNPSQKQLFEDIAAFHLRHAQNTANGAQQDANASTEEPAAKKRKLANGSASVPSRGADVRSETVLELREVSFSIPQRKKLHFRVVQYTSPSGTSPTLGVQAVNPANDAVEYELPSSELAHVLRTPVPEKATKQYNFIFIPSGSSALEPILFTVPATPPKGGTFTFPEGASSLEDALAAVFRSQNLALTLPDEKEFASATPEAHRKSEKAYHVKAFRGSKDGFLFFLSTGIFFGFKKPLLFLALEDIESISYTSVLQRTFNLNIVFRKPGSEDEEDETEEVEFSMLDQSDHGGINEYIQRHGLNDASLAAGRRAKSVNKKKATNGNDSGEAGNEEAGEEDGRTELEKAEAELQDEEDEMEEDFEPSDEDDDSGSGSDEESDDEGGGSSRRVVSGKASKNLVEEELGSEAEDVDMSEEDDAGEDEDEEGDEGIDEDADDRQEEEIVEAPVMKTTHQPAMVQGRWGAAVNNEPDPDDDDQL